MKKAAGAKRQRTRGRGRLDKGATSLRRAAVARP